jgi:hypothetical protein
MARENTPTEVYLIMPLFVYSLYSTWLAYIFVVEHMLSHSTPEMRDLLKSAPLSALLVCCEQS